MSVAVENRGNTVLGDIEIVGHVVILALLDLNKFSDVDEW